MDLKRLAPRTIQNFGPLFAVAILAGALIFWFDQKTANATTAKIGSCYQLVTLGDIDPPSASRDLYVLVDQTMTLPKKLQEETYRKIIEFLRPGDVIQIIGFSANAAGFYTEVILKGIIDNRLGDEIRYSVSKKVLHQLDQCYQAQDTQVRQYTGRALIHALYGNGKLENLPIDQEIKKLGEKLAFEDMSNAKVYVIGGGYLDNGNYRSSLELKALEHFWASYFEHSNAELKQFGTPSLLSGIGN